MTKEKQPTREIIYARGYYAGLRFGQQVEANCHKRERKQMSLLFWATWACLALNCLINHYVDHLGYRAMRVMKQREYQVKDFLYEQYRSGAANITDQMNALGFEEDVLGLEFQKVEAMVDSGVAPGVAKSKVFME